jgi:tetratricopeptide (TPR) repeat protein
MGRSALASRPAELLDDKARIAELDDGERSVAAAVMASRHELPPAEGRLFDLLALHPGPDIDIHAIGALADLELHDAERCLDRLHDRHLIEQYHAGRYQFHDLVGAVARHQAEPDLADAEREAAFRRLIDYYLVVAEVTDTLITPHRYRISLDVAHQPAAVPALRDYDDALAWLSTEDDNLSAICRAAGAAGVDSACWQLAYTPKGYYFLTKRWEPWQVTHQAALLAAQRLQDRRAEATTSNHLGLAAIEQGDADAAATWYHRALDLFRTVGDEHGEHTALANYAWILFDQGDYQGFLDLSNQSLAFYRLSGSTRNVAITLRGIGLAEAQHGVLESRSLGRADLTASRAGGQEPVENPMHAEPERRHRPWSARVTFRVVYAGLVGVPAGQRLGRAVEVVVVEDLGRARCREWAAGAVSRTDTLEPRACTKMAEAVLCRRVGQSASPET